MNADGKTIGLCMIVKNEAHLILRCLESVRSLVDYVLIEDTGSTDGTQVVIREWLNRVGIPGDIFDEPWRDFAYNRSHALARLRENEGIDYALVIDADDQLVVEAGFNVAVFKESLSQDLYKVPLRQGLVNYQVNQILSNKLEFRCRGVLHEFIEGPPEGFSSGTAAGFYILSGREGARSQDPDKYRKDAQLLERALQGEQDAFLRSRYTFYLARSYRDAGEMEKALDNYLQRAKLGYWTEEVFESLYGAAELLRAMGRPFHAVIAMYLRASDAVPSRAEALHAASRLCRENYKFADGFKYALRGLHIPLPVGGLFVQPWVYDYGLRDEFAINAYWTERYAECVDACDRLLSEGKLPTEQRERVLKNKQFAIDKLQVISARPHKAKPSYELAKHYREQRMNLECALVCEAGLAASRPEQEAHSLEDHAYTVRLLEEYSIAANYSRDPARKDRGFTACNWLALNRAVPDGSRNLARNNLRFYVQTANTMMPSFAARSVGFAPPDGYRPMNPSIARQGEDIVLVQRSVSYTLTEDGQYHRPKGVPQTRNFLLRLNGNLETLSSREILLPADLPKADPGVETVFADLRLFAWRDGLWCNGYFRELTAAGICHQVLARIDESGNGTCRLADWRVLKPEGPVRHEKNWMPRVAGEILRFIYLCDPTHIVDDQAQTVAETTAAIAAEQFRGGSQAVEFDGGRLALVHEVLAGASDKQRVYHHRFVWFDEEGVLRGVSRPFFFRKQGVEFAAGLAWNPDGKSLLISYGVGDAEAWMATVDVSDVRAILDATDPLSSMTFDGRPIGSETTANYVPTTRAAIPSILRMFHFITGLDENFGGVPLTPIVEPLVRPRPAWTPQTPSAGTELMVAGLRERIGKELERINLQVNHPGHDKTDKRPRVVWMHHHVNQRWVQWCKDRELVDSISCFVFVSYWQREQYLNAFGLPPQRCIVLRHALDLRPDLRRWEAGSILRCAYTSTPFRGLSVLLDAWQRLNPGNAELHVWSSMKLYLEDDGPYKHLYERAESMPGVIYHGIAPNPELRTALRSMHFLAYPCTFAETACLAVIEAMAAGCRVIVPSLGALPETTGGYARIYPSNPNAEEHIATFSENLAAELATPWSGEPELSLSQQGHCAVVYDWSRRLREWHQLIQWACDQTNQSEAGNTQLTRISPVIRGMSVEPS